MLEEEADLYLVLLGQEVSMCQFFYIAFITKCEANSAMPVMMTFSEFRQELK